MKLVTMSDGEQLVNFQLNSDGSINDCKVIRRRRMALGMLKYDVENNAGDEDIVEYLDAEDLDIQWYGRQCNRFLRRVDLEQNVKDKQILNKEMPGTKYCTRFGATYNPRFIDGNNAEDNCCKILKGCNHSIPYMHYRHGYFNANLYDITECQCLDEFKICLQNVDTDLSHEIQRLFFELLDMKCYQHVSHETCQKYSKWFETCEESNIYLTLKSRKLN